MPSRWVRGAPNDSTLLFYTMRNVSTMGRAAREIYSQTPLFNDWHPMPYLDLAASRRHQAYNPS